MTFSAVALNAARRSGETGAGVAFDRFLDGKSEVAVGGCRDWSRHVVFDDSTVRPTLTGYPIRAVSGKESPLPNVIEASS